MAPGVSRNFRDWRFSLWRCLRMLTSHLVGAIITPLFVDDYMIRLDCYYHTNKTKNGKDCIQIGNCCQPFGPELPLAFIIQICARNRVLFPPSRLISIKGRFTCTTSGFRATNTDFGRLVALDWSRQTKTLEFKRMLPPALWVP